jgi:hypothetical protein
MLKFKGWTKIWKECTSKCEFHLKIKGYLTPLLFNDCGFHFKYIIALILIWFESCKQGVQDLQVAQPQSIYSSSNQTLKLLNQNMIVANP